MRARHISIGAAAGLAIGAAIAAASPVTTGCTTHQCDGSFATFTGGSMVDDDTYETSDVSGTWPAYGPNVTLRINYPADVAARVAGRVPVSIAVSVGTSSQPNPAGNSTTASGQLDEFSFVDPTGFSVFNDTCADYFVRVVATYPSLPPSTAAVPGVTGATVFGGAMSASTAGDTWSWNGTTWSRPLVESPPARSGAAAATLNAEVVVFGGALAAPASSAGADAGASDATTADASADDATPDAPTTDAASSGATLSADTWVWNGALWNQVLATPSPSARTGAVAAVQGGQVVLFGGTDGSTRLNDTWTWNGAAWTQAMPLPAVDGGLAAPPARSGAVAAAFDGQVVLFGGTPDGTTALGDTWTWNGTAWTEVVPAPDAGPSPPARFAASAAVLGGAFVVFGGTPDGVTALGDTWTWNGTAWAQATPLSPADGGPASPPARFGASASSISGRVVVFGGTPDGVTALGDTWTWDGTSWTASTMLGPPARFDAAMSGL